MSRRIARPSERARSTQRGPAPLWTPPGDRTRASNLAAFAAWLAERGDGPGARWRPAPWRPQEGYRDLWRWSIDDQPAFWSAAWDWFGIVGHKGDRVIVDGHRMPGARYFPDARLNVAENILRRRTDDPAIIAAGERGQRRVVTWQELHDHTSRLAQAMRAAGVGPGDRVAALLPNVPEAVVVMLASASIGAVLSTASPDFGVRGVVDRFGQVAPRLLFVTAGYEYRGKRYDTIARVPAILAELSTVKRTVVVPNLGRTGSGPQPHVSLDAFIRPFAARDIDFARLPFDHPLYILFSSGTTGAPKCIVHRAGGVLLQHVKEHRLHCDVKPGDRVFYFTTLGWMMWNWLVSALASQATILLWDGSPVHPRNDVLFDFAEDADMSLMGVSPGFLEALRNAGVRPRATHDLSSLRTLLCTGSPVPAAGYEYAYEHVKRNLHFASISGGTDLCACFVGAVPGLPVRAGEIQGPVLGMAVDVYSTDGLSMDAGKGELVCTRPFPSLPLGFLRDDEGKRYRDTYFARFPGVWHHGDYAEKTPRGGYVIHGRSDATLNVRGVRIGTAEVYRPVEAMSEVAEALAIEQRWGDGTRMVLFVRLGPGVRLDAALRDRIRTELRTQASPRHVPARIVQVNDVPHTRSGKIVELAVRAVVHGQPVQNVEALANPEALAQFRNRAELAASD